MNFTSIPETPEYHNTFRIKEITSNIDYFEDLELHTIELRKFMKDVGDELSTVMSRVKNKVDLWAAFLTKYDLLNKDNLSGVFDDPNLKKALDVLDIMNFNKAEREEYEAHLKWMRIEANTIKKASRNAEEEGRMEGREEGRREGREEGEKNKARQIAQSLLDSGMNPESVASITGLSADDMRARK